MSKKIIVSLIIILPLVSGGFFIFLNKSDILSNNPFLASVAEFLSLGDGEKKTFSLSEGEFSSLKQKIAFLEESLEAREEESENLDDLTEKFDVFDQKITELEARMQVLASEISETRGQEETAQEEESDEEGVEESEEVTKEVGQEIGQKLCEVTTGIQPLRNKLIINEIAWMGTINSANDEWIELKNISGNSINLNNWQILDKDRQIEIIFRSGEQFSANSFYLLERTDDETVPGVTADLIYSGTLSNTDEALYLFDGNCQLQDEVLANPDWPAGDNSSKRTMERKPDLTWQTSLSPGGTPKAGNSSGYIAAPIISGGGGGGAPPPAEPTPEINLSYPQGNPVNKQIEVEVSVSNFKNIAYDVKISIEKDGVLSRICKIYNQEEENWQCPEEDEQWQSSVNYLNNVFIGPVFTGNFRLNVREDKNDFRGEADIVARIRETGKTGYLAEFKGKINITDPEPESVVKYNLAIDIIGQGTTTPVFGTHTYEKNEEVTVIAYPDEGWRLIGWSGDVTSEEVTIIITMDEDKSVTANFEEEESEPEPPAPNLLLNPGFEDVVDWIFETKASRSSEQARTGSWSAKQAELTTSYAREIKSSSISTAAGKKYILGEWYYLKDPDADGAPEDYTLFLRVRWDGVSTGQTPSSGFNPTAFNIWTYIEFEVTAKADTIFGDVVITAKRDAGIITDVYWDDISFVSQ